MKIGCFGFVLVGLSSLFCHGQDIKVTVPHQPPRLQVHPLIDEMPAHPYERAPFEARSTFARISEASERVVVCSVERLRVEPLDENNYGSNVVVLDLHVREDLYGDGPEKVQAVVEVRPGVSLPVEESLLLFLSTVESSGSDRMTYSWELGYDLSKGDLFVVGGDRGIIEISSGNEEYILKTMEGYLQNLRGEMRDARRYISFLSGLLASPYERVRRDARSDLYRYMRSLDDGLLNEIAEDDDENNDAREFAKWWLKVRALR